MYLRTSAMRSIAPSSLTLVGLQRRQGRRPSASASSAVLHRSARSCEGVRAMRTRGGRTPRSSSLRREISHPACYPCRVPLARISLHRSSKCSSVIVSCKCVVSASCEQPGGTTTPESPPTSTRISPRPDHRIGRSSSSEGRHLFGSTRSSTPSTSRHGSMWAATTLTSNASAVGSLSGRVPKGPDRLKHRLQLNRAFHDASRDAPIGMALSSDSPCRACLFRADSPSPLCAVERGRTR
jgi:hypothetical protein